MKRTLLVIAALLSGAPAPSPAFGAEVAPAPQVLTFTEALARALQVNNTIEGARADVQVAEANRQQLLSGVLPRINATGNLVRNSTAVTLGSGSDERTILAQNDWSYRVVLSQPVYAGRREFRAYSQANLGIDNARLAAYGTEDAVLLRVASNYLELVNSDARIAIEQRNIDLADKRRTQANAFFQAGEVTKVDVLRAETAIKVSQRALALAQQSREGAAGRLRVDLDLTGPITPASTEHPLPAVPDEATLVSLAQSARPDVTLAANNLKIAELEVKKQRGFWWPVVTFDGGLIAQKAQFPASKYSYGALRFTVPILQSGEVEARVAAAREGEIKARLALDSAKTGAREDVHQALVDLQAAETTLSLSKDQLTAAEAEYNQEFELYRAQEATSLDLASSEQSLADARRAVNESSLNRDLAELRVWYAAGAMKDATGLNAASKNLNGANQ
ncbi:MAG: TolC family protein [Thermoanaerobaculia bacterium]